jgi:hypothetical protein
VRAAAGSSTCPRADNPLVFASPGRTLIRLCRGRLRLRHSKSTSPDAGGGAGAWSVSLTIQSGLPRPSSRSRRPVTVPRASRGHVTTTKAPDAEATGVRRPHPRRREATASRTGSGPAAAKLRQPKATPLRLRGLVLVEHQGRHRAHHELQLPAFASGPRVLREAARPGARLPAHARRAARTSASSSQAARRACVSSRGSCSAATSAA